VLVVKVWGYAKEIAIETIKRVHELAHLAFSTVPFLATLVSCHDQQDEDRPNAACQANR
jgi:hypothetical protein